jgi:hypothetical protein
MAERPKFTVEEWDRWLPAKAVFDQAKKTLGAQECWAAVIDRVKGGHIEAVARSFSSSKGSGPVTTNRDPFPIPVGFWQSWVEDTSRLVAGDARFRIPPERYGGSFRIDSALEVLCFGIRLDPEQVMLHFPEPPAVEPVPARVNIHHYAGGNTWVDREYDTGPVEEPAENPQPTAKHAGGAPRKKFWDDLFIEMFRQLWEGELTPERPSDIGNAMLDWAEKQGHKLGETSVKEPARKLFDAYKSGVKN